MKIISTILVTHTLVACGFSSTAYKDFEYDVRETDFMLQVSGLPFQVEADNCGGVEASSQTTTRSQRFVTKLNIEISHEVAAEFGGDIKVAEASLSSQIGEKLGIEIGVETETSSSIEIKTSPGSRTITTLQWKVKWTRGDISILRPDRSYVAVLPFAVLNSLDLEQQNVKTIDCKSGEIISQESVPQLLPTVVPIPTSVLDPTATSTDSPQQVTKEFIDDLFGKDNWFCLVGSPTGIGIRNLPVRLIIQNPLIQVDSHDKRYKAGQVTASSGPATAWFESPLINSNCSNDRTPPTKAEVDLILEAGNWFCLADSPNGLKVINIPSNFVVQSPLIAMDKEDKKYARGESIPAGGPATAWLRADLPRDQCP